MSPAEKKNPKTQEIRPASWNKSRLMQILRAARGKRVLVLGDVGVDRYTIGMVERISPEAPVPIVLVEEEKLKLGLAANVADNVQTLGGVAWLVGVIGRDHCAQDFRRLLRGSGIVASHLVVDGSRRTVLKERVVSDRQQLLRIDYENLHALDAVAQRGILKKIGDLIDQVDGVILEDYAKGLLSARMMKEVFALARRAGKPVAVDPNARTPMEYYKGAYVLTPNTKEAEKLAGIAITDPASLTQAGRAILKATGARHVVITRGKEGMALFSRDNPVVRLIPTYAREVYDVSGAGDTVISLMALALAAGASIEEASVLGNLGAGVVVGKRGTATVTPSEIQVAMEFFGTMGVS